MPLIFIEHFHPCSNRFFHSLDFLSIAKFSTIRHYSIGSESIPGITQAKRKLILFTIWSEFGWVMTEKENKMIAHVYHVNQIMLSSLQKCFPRHVFERMCVCRSTCENVMKVLRNNKDSVMAMLEAFVHDPLINWRLLNTTDTVPETATSRDAENKELGTTSLHSDSFLLSTSFRSSDLSPHKTCLTCRPINLHYSRGYDHVLICPWWSLPFWQE